jgi:hypothetical protein
MAKHKQYLDTRFGAERCRVKFYFDSHTNDKYPSWTWQGTKDRLLTYVNQPTIRQLRKAPKDTGSQVMAHMATPSQYVLVRRIPATAKDNLYKLFDLMDQGLSPYTDVPEVGFFVPYRYATDEMVFVAHAGVRKGVEDRDPERDSMRIYRMKPNEMAIELEWYRRRKEVNNLASNFTENEFLTNRLTTYGWKSRLCYVDRTTQSEKDKLSLLKIAPVGVYVPECGMRLHNHGCEVFVLLTDK